MAENYYLFTEIVGCGKIGATAIQSFHAHHDHVIHIYGKAEDFLSIPFHKNNVFIEVGAPVVRAYETKGHLGTALLWENAIRSTDKECIIHFDSDVFFRKNIIDTMLEIAKTYDMVGPIRNYHHNNHGINEISHLTDICQTSCFLFKKRFISKQYIECEKSVSLPSPRAMLRIPPMLFLRKIKSFIKYHSLRSGYRISELGQMIHGNYNPLNFRTLDFFDPVAFDMVTNGAKIYHLDYNQVGGTDFYGKRDNNFASLNNPPTPNKIDFGTDLVHFSAVGSGMNFYSNPTAKENAGRHYSEYSKVAINRYALFCNIFYDELLPGVPIEEYLSQASEIKALLLKK